MFIFYRTCFAILRNIFNDKCEKGIFFFNVMLLVKAAKIIKHMPNKKKRLAIESVVVLLTGTIIQISGKVHSSPTLTQLIIAEYNINKHLH